MATANNKRKRNNSQTNSTNNSSFPPTKKPRNIRQIFLDCESVISSLQFHPTTHTFAASCFNGQINLYTINQVKSTKLIHTFHHPNHNNNTQTSQIQSLNELIQSNKQKMERLKQLQIKNNQSFTSFNDMDSNDSDSENDNDKLSLISIKNNNIDTSNSISCKHTLFNNDGSIIFGAWTDSEISMFDYSKQSLIHHFNNNNNDSDNNSKLSAIKMYNSKLLVTGNVNGIIRCWDIRMNLNKTNKSQRQYQYSSQIHKLMEHEDAINCFESIPCKHRLFAGTSDGEISVWDLRKSSDLNAIKQEMIQKKNKILLKKKYSHGQKLSKNENRLLKMFDENQLNIKPKTLKAVSDRLGDEVLCMCLMKYNSKLCCGMTSGNMNLFNYNEWNWYCDRIKGHSSNLSCIVKFDDDCCITGCDDGVVRLISLYPHKFIHSIGTHELNPIDCIAMSFDKLYVISFASGDKKAMLNHNRTNRVSLKRNFEYNKTQKEIIKIWDMNWHPVVIANQKQNEKKDKFNRRRHMNLCRLPRGVKEFLELSDDDFDVNKLDNEKLIQFRKKKARNQKRRIDDYEFSDDSLNELDDSDGESDGGGNENELKLNVESDVNMQRRIKYKTFESRDCWIKSLGNRKKIRAVGQHDVNQYHRKKFFRGLST